MIWESSPIIKEMKMPLADWNERCGTLRLRAKPAKPATCKKKKPEGFPRAKQQRKVYADVIQRKLHSRTRKPKNLAASTMWFCL